MVIAGFIGPVHGWSYLPLFKIPSNVWLFIQGIPGTVAWGIIPYYLITFYLRHKNFSVQLGTVLLIILGLGTIVGKLLGGIIGNKLYLKKRKYLPIAAGFSQLIGVTYTHHTLLACKGESSILRYNSPCNIWICWSINNLLCWT